MSAQSTPDADANHGLGLHDGSNPWGVTAGPWHLLPPQRAERRSHWPMEAGHASRIVHESGVQVTHSASFLHVTRLREHAGRDGNGPTPCYAYCVPSVIQPGF